MNAFDHHFNQAEWRKCFREKRYEKTLEKDCVLLVDMYNKKYLTLELETREKVSCGRWAKRSRPAWSLLLNMRREIGKEISMVKDVGMGKAACVEAVLIYFLGFRCWVWMA